MSSDNFFEISTLSDDHIAAVRNFSRFYTRQIRLMCMDLRHSKYSLTEARIVFELAHRTNLTASDLCRELDLDAGYLSRILNKLEQQNLIEKSRSDEDGRQRLIKLTYEGQKAFELLDQRSNDEVSEILNKLSSGDRVNLVDAMATIEGILDKSFKYSEPFYLRQHEAGDMGWVIHQHGLLYHREYGWDERFEMLVARICLDFVNTYDAQREHCWIAEMQGEQVGSIFCIRENEDVAKLRLLLVSPKMRGSGLGTLLVNECIRFARRAGYKKLTLWTSDILVEARKIYDKADFLLVEEERHRSFGHDLVGQNLELVL
ncbi:MAG: bifunctional helix-turn-helix transcriptional regulator/GNAT family N-acetyltransferase [Pseudomonadales bacterium]|mgnify:CR=1 FL=1|jgi:DNA-binding MarR family transcriptional regulator/N-acetylglutamate synthase-like GNAT family acetyltransferase|nr:bifunctional helix-turn-helix transcriptional regulator/GNAT family N-acetyltransferase [Pseudomonadales bacterium]